MAHRPVLMLEKIYFRVCFVYFSSQPLLIGGFGLGNRTFTLWEAVL
jgi:hypothetical protein